MKFDFIKNNQDSFDVEVMCAVFAVTPAGFYAWLKRPGRSRAGRARLGEPCHHQAHPAK